MPPKAVLIEDYSYLDTIDLYDIPTDTESDSRIAFVGPSQAGKSVKGKAFMHHMCKDANGCLMISASDHNDDYECIKKGFRRNDIEQSDLQKVFKVSERRLRLNKKGANFRTKIFIAMDDMGDHPFITKKAKKDKAEIVFDTIMIKARQFTIGFLYFCHQFTYLPAKTRSSFTHIVITDIQGDTEMLNFKKAFATDLTIKEFTYLVKKATLNKGALVILTQKTGFRNRYKRLYLDENILVPNFRSPKPGALMYPDFDTFPEDVQKEYDEHFFDWEEYYAEQEEEQKKEALKAEKKAKRKAQKEAERKQRLEGSDPSVRPPSPVAVSENQYLTSLHQPQPRPQTSMFTHTMPLNTGRRLLVQEPLLPQKNQELMTKTFSSSSSKSIGAGSSMSNCSTVQKALQRNQLLRSLPRTPRNHHSNVNPSSSSSSLSASSYSPSFQSTSTSYSSSSF